VQFPIAIGALPQTPPPFLSWHKKGGKKSQDCARFARKIVVRKAQIVQLVEVRWSFYKDERAWHELQLRTRTIFNRLPRLFFGSSAEVEDQEVIIINQWINILTDSRFLKTFSLNTFSLCSFYCLFPWSSLNAFSLNTFTLCSFYLFVFPFFVSSQMVETLHAISLFAKDPAFLQGELKSPIIAG